MTRTTARLAGALVAGTLVLAGCSGDDRPRSSMDGSMMGGSERAPSTGQPEDGATFNDVDVTFARDMVPHHRQAIGMARLAEGRAADPRVLDLADRIEAAQEPEIGILTGLLAEWGAGGGGGHMGGGMGHPGDDPGGMMSPEDMHGLMAASGAEFDRLFLEQMIDHHSGAVRMAETVLSDGRNTELSGLAETIRDAQTAEIAEMEQLLTELG
ncbi:DUF305 domain-containing protein [Blastococcus tunisiensis]|uniref:Uncharacterized conserved protein, DUF305 family n=1 Tax=Blastococcus tunisiensis TaxID=1798228 RepID=A0A1I2GY61_9ACTN|nr:DUF305 domain-containing protein [Blastococcus sp. DSM 46838]SFF22362.1 Uncharacterized conserved protein, DUF305 family [Blastococcus sp. DSM 46838]